ncbi:MAG: UDP-N-acetylmuramate dehydrogenase [Clostridiales Family XIII bacterium]|jgi:UDP-N-acetylmuramate dehydrogenase|nr:UDP-N-acetylmuramate dehydrogenase [Clostridiales Family XIII bacterium]
MNGEYNRDKIAAELRKILSRGTLVRDVSMAGYTSFRAGGKADLLAEPASCGELTACAGFLEKSGAPWMIIGNGSNLLVRDGGFRGVIVRLGAMFSAMEIRENALYAQAGTLLSMAAEAAAEASLSGLEFACGIPGSVGGAVFMNAGAYGREIRDILASVTLLSERNGYAEKTSDDIDSLEFSYRGSIFQKNRDIVVGAAFFLKKDDPRAIRERMRGFVRERNEKQPVNMPSAGSAFKRPEGAFAGRLIREAGLQGLVCGGAQVSTLHAGFIVNTGGAKAADIISLIGAVRQSVLERFGILLEPEVRIVGEDLPAKARAAENGRGELNGT